MPRDVDVVNNDDDDDDRSRYEPPPPPPPSRPVGGILNMSPAAFGVLLPPMLLLSEPYGAGFHDENSF